MKLGLILNSQFTSNDNLMARVNELIEQVKLCRDSGFDAVHVVQHFLSSPFEALQLWPLLGRIAAESGNMRVGSCIFLLPLSNPVYAAEHVATMDVLSGGRFIFGVGLGFRDEEFEAFGVDRRTRAPRFNESLKLLRKLLTGEKVTHAGEFFRLTNAEIRPLPVQRPHPPIWIAASGDLGVKRAARHGLPWLINPHASVGTIEEQMKIFRQVLAGSGHEAPTDVPMFRELAIGRTHEEAVAAAAPFLESKYAAYAEWGLDRPMPSHERLTGTFEQLARDRFIVGTVDECISTIAGYRERLGVTDVLCRLQWPGMSHREAMRQIEQLGEAVIPTIAKLS